MMNTRRTTDVQSFMHEMQVFGRVLVKDVRGMVLQGKLIVCIQGSHLVTLRQGGIIEDGSEKIVQPTS